MSALVPFQIDLAPASAPFLYQAIITLCPLAPPLLPENLTPERVSCAPVLRLKVNVLLSGCWVRPPNPPASGRLWDRFRFLPGPPRTGLRPWGGSTGDPEPGSPGSELCFMGWPDKSSSVGGSRSQATGHVAGVVKLVFPTGRTRFSATRVSIFFP